MATRSTAVTAAVAAAAALAATGITYASAASEPAQAAPVAQQAIAAPASVPQGGGDTGKGYEGKGNEGHEGGGGHEKRHHFHIGKIRVNEREYPAIPDGCVVVVSGLGSTSLNVRNDSHRTVEVFNGATCDNGAPIATVGPWSQADGLFLRHIKGGVKVKHGVVGSFRVIKRHHHDEKGDDYDRD
ncbi:hypothetical protein NGF19_23945 [Streptomyces sp. RY43-2]|uniref:Secreted protein n=1 Tax=Streptomyces macrolidinus TaxID=2952607 RepID=A0ABT0ZJM6_9ACTN|nr:hypothetical protein [Streptomyces macrolidinus]MCN9243794.1 hypothetical protein [Streptomyces macrolidinus]